MFYEYLVLLKGIGGVKNAEEWFPRYIIVSWQIEKENIVVLLFTAHVIQDKQDVYTMSTEKRELITGFAEWILKLNQVWIKCSFIVLAYF